MIIRSQDKKQLVNFDVCHIGITRDNCVIAVNGLVASPSEILRGIIGKYSTEEKAVKVLDMICRGYASIELEKVGMNITADLVEGIEDMLFGVFEMPQDSEV